MQKTPHQRDDCVTGVLQNIVACVRESIYFRRREALNPFLQKQNLVRPSRSNWYLLKPKQIFLDALEQRVRSI
jgi:hypothetical protein